MAATIDELNAMFKNTLCESLGMRITEGTAGRLVATMPVDTRTRQLVGLLHGGASLALAETVASIGGYLLVADEGKIVAGQEINANHLRSVQDGNVTAVGEVIHKGKTSQVWGVSIYDDAQRLVCVSRCTLAVITPRTDI
ncbi:MAG: hotdog fold thioesterase [Burkholderiales bacterium]